MLDGERSSPLEVLEVFVGLAREARRRALPMDERARLVELDERLRDLIDGARPAPKRIEGHARAAASEPRAPTAHQVMEELSVDSKTARKLNRVGLHEVRSAYTPSRKPAFLDAYFEDAVDEIEDAPAISPRQVVDAEGQPVDLPVSTRDLWEIGQVDGSRPAPRGAIQRSAGRAERSAPAVAPAAERSAPTVAPATERSAPTVTPAAERSAPTVAPAAERSAPAVAPATERMASAAEDRTRTLPPAIIHLKGGGQRRGFIERFDAAAGRILLVPKDAPQNATEIRLDEVLVIFFGRRKSDAASEKTGTRLSVTLVNGKRVSGYSADYQPNGSALTVVPERDGGGVDRVWVPAWSVEAVAVTD